MQSVYFDDSQTMSWVLGINDRNVNYLEILLGTVIYVRGNSVSAVEPFFFFTFFLRFTKSARIKRSEFLKKDWLGSNCRIQLYNERTYKKCGSRDNTEGRQRRERDTF